MKNGRWPTIGKRRAVDRLEGAGSLGQRDRRDARETFRDG